MKIEPGTPCYIHDPHHSAHGWFVTAESIYAPTERISTVNGVKFHTPPGVAGTIWLIVGNGIPYGEHKVQRGLASEDCLRPMLDPGDDAVDEMVKLVGKPKELVYVRHQGKMEPFKENL